MKQDILPKLSIVTPSYNQGQFLEETILSVLNQGYPDLEYIIIDGGSTDGSAEIIKKYRDRLSYWVSEPDEGQTHAINKGFAVSSGAIMNWLNSDDVLLPGALEAVAEAFARHPTAEFVFGDCDLIDPDGNVLMRQYSPEFGRNVMLYGRSVTSQPACFWKRSAWERLGKLDEKYDFCMDTEYWTRAVVTGCEFRLVRYPLAATRLHQGAKTSTIRNELSLEHMEILNRYKLLPLERQATLNRVIYRTLVLLYKTTGAWHRLKSRRRFAPLKTVRLLSSYRV